MHYFLSHYHFFVSGSRLLLYYLFGSVLFVLFSTIYIVYWSCFIYTSPGGIGVRELTRGLATLPKDPLPRWIQEPLVVRDRDGRPPRGPPRSALLLYVAGVHCWEISLSKQIHGTSVIFVNENENYQKRKNSDSVNEN